MNASKSIDWVQPLILLPTQVPAVSRSGRSPALCLMLAIVQDAVQCALNRNKPIRRGERDECHEAWKWLLDDARDWPFAFLNLCDWLGLDAGAIRHSLSNPVRGDKLSELSRLTSSLLLAK